MDPPRRFGRKRRECPDGEHGESGDDSEVHRVIDRCEGAPYIQGERAKVRGGETDFLSR